MRYMKPSVVAATEWCSLHHWGCTLSLSLANFRVRGEAFEESLAAMCDHRFTPWELRRVWLNHA